MATRLSVLPAVICALLLAQGCSSARAVGETAKGTSANSNGDAVGCHPAGNAPSGSASVELASNAVEHPIVVRSNEMVFVKGGGFRMGTADGLPVEGPEHDVVVRSFWIDSHEVTAAQFDEFVQATGYKTEAEQFGWSGVFDVRSGSWKKMDGVDWRHPDGPGSTVASNEPVTQVSWRDASAYSSWAGKRLPTEAEFEYAARGALAGKRYAWGDELEPNGRYLANFWQGAFPARNLGEDGFIGRAPVGQFDPNGYGLYDMTGNVWEWCADWFGEGYYKVSPRVDPKGPSTGETRVIRGGSWLCSDNYCTGYRVAARNHTAPDSGLNNLGFRCVRD